MTTPRPNLANGTSRKKALNMDFSRGYIFFTVAQHYTDWNMMNFNF